MLVFWHLLVDEHHVGGDGVGLVLGPLPHGLYVGHDGQSLVCLELGLCHPEHHGRHVCGFNRTLRRWCTNQSI